MTAFATWDIIVVPFPYSDRLAEKRRPALVVSDPALEEETGMLWVVMITGSDPGHRGAIPVREPDPTGLGRPSWVRPSKVTTIETARVVRRAGTLAQADRGAVRQSLQRVAGWA